MSTFTALLKATAQDQLQGGRCTVDEIVATAYEEHGDLFGEESERLIFQAARRIVKDILRDLSEDDGEQLELPGVSLPSAIAVRGETGITYVGTQAATWADLLAGKQEREHNVSAAQAKLDIYEASLRRLAAQMENDPSCTVADAIERSYPKAA